MFNDQNYGEMVASTYTYTYEYYCVGCQHEKNKKN